MVAFLASWQGSAEIHLDGKLKRHGAMGKPSGGIHRGEQGKVGVPFSMVIHTRIAKRLRLVWQLRVILFAALLFSSIEPAQAQTANASLTGRITDSSKAVVPNARVIVISTGTRVRYETITNQTGSYFVGNLTPGTYRIEVEKLGFKAVLKSNLVLHVQDALEINFEMLIGSASESVTVRGGAPL